MRKNVNSGVVYATLFTSILVCAFIARTSLVLAQSECDYTVGAGEQHATITSALSQAGISLAGKTICVRDDKIYGPVQINVGGALNNPLIIQAHPNNSGRPIFKNTQAYTVETKNGSVFAVKADNVTVRGIEVAQGPASGFGISSDNLSNPRKNVRLENVVAHHTYNSGIKMLKAKDIVIDGCELYMVTLAGSPACHNNPVCDAVAHGVSEQLHAVDSENIDIRNCKIHTGDSIRGGTIGVLRSSFITIRNNEVFDSEGNMTHIDDSDNITIQNNLLYETCSDNTYNHGMYKLDENNPRGRDITIKNNLIVGAKGGINFAGCQHASNCPLQNVLVENNTVLGARENAAIKFGTHNPTNNIVVRKNIFHRIGTGNDGINQLGNAVQFTNNIWSKMSGASGSDQVVANLNGVFQNSIDPDACVSSPLNPLSYRVASAYPNMGAAVDDVGIKSDLLPITPGPTPTSGPTNTPGASPTNLPDEPEDWDLNNNGVVNLYDFNIFIRRVLNGNQQWSNMSQFIVAFRADQE